MQDPTRKKSPTPKGKGLTIQQSKDTTKRPSIENMFSREEPLTIYEIQQATGLDLTFVCKCVKRLIESGAVLYIGSKNNFRQYQSRKGTENE